MPVRHKVQKYGFWANHAIISQVAVLCSLFSEICCLLSVVCCLKIMVTCKAILIKGMRVDFINEFQLNQQTQAEVAELRAICFPDSSGKGRTYFKQLPHYRLLLRNEQNKTVGQVGIDYRIMNLNGEVVTVMGVIDLAVHPDYRGYGHGAWLIKEMEKLATDNPNNVDFIFLVTDIPAFYEKLGYATTTVHTTWLKIHQGKNYGLGNEMVTDCYLMYKQMGKKQWADGELDWLGYWY